MTLRRRLSTSLILSVALVVVLVAPLHAQQGTGAVFLARLGVDTLAVEVMTRMGRTADATLRYRTPAVRIRQTVQLSEHEFVQHVRTAITQGTTGDSTARVSELTFVGDSARVHAGSPDTPDQTIGVPKGAVPFLNLSGLSIEMVLRRARALGGDSVSVPVLIIGATRPYVAIVVRGAGDSVIVTIAGVTMRAKTDSVGELLGMSVPTQRLVMERLPATSPVAAWTGASAPVSYAAPSGAPYTAQDYYITARRGRLAGTLTMPAHVAGARVPAVVLISGSGPQDRDEGTPALPKWRPFREFADTLSRRGIAVLRLDDRGVGGSTMPAPGTTMLDEAEDVRDAVAWLRARADVDPNRVGLVGHSSGSVVAPMVAAADPRVRAIVLIAAPASTGKKISEYQIRYLFSEDTVLPPVRRDSLLRVALRQADSAFAAVPWLAQFGDYDPLPTARLVHASTLILHGETDRQVPVTDAGRLIKSMRDAGNRKVTLRTFPRMNHLLVEDPSGSTLHYDALPDLHVRRDLLGMLADWLARAL